MSATPPIPPAHLRGAIDLSSLVAPPAGARQAAAPPRSGSAQPGAAADAVEVPALVLAGTDADFTRFIELSQVVPVLVDLRASWSEPSAALSPVLERITVELDGRLVLVALDVDANPQLAQAFQAQSVPTVAAVIGGRPVPLFSGVMDEAQLRDVVDQVLALAAEHGVVGTAVVVGGGDATAPPEPPLPPHHAEAQDAIARGDYAAAAAEYRTAIAQNPRDSLAVAALAQVHLLQRLEDADAQTVRSAAAADPTDLAASLAVADLDVAGGHVDDAFDRILTVFVQLDSDGKQTARARLVELFEVVGQDDPRVAAARRRLTMLLF